MSTKLTQNAEAVKVALANQNKKLDEFETTLKNLSRSLSMLIGEFQTFKNSSLQDIAKKFDGGPTELE